MFRIVTHAMLRQWKINPAPGRHHGLLGRRTSRPRRPSTHFDDRYPARLLPMLIYPVITMQDRPTQWDTRNNLLGPQPDAALVERYSSERQVTPQTPPALHRVERRRRGGAGTRNSTLFLRCAQGERRGRRTAYLSDRSPRLDRRFHLLGRISWGFVALARTVAGRQDDRIVRTDGCFRRRNRPCGKYGTEKFFHTKAVCHRRAAFSVPVSGRSGCSDSWPAAVLPGRKQPPRRDLKYDMRKIRSCGDCRHVLS